MDELREKIKREYGYEGKSKQYQLGFDSALKEILALLPQWTRVEDGLPEVEGLYLIKFEGGGITHGGKRHAILGERYLGPLPQPPKEEEDD